jgi:hypothetical protein
VAAVLASVADLESDFEAASLLLQVARQQAIEGTLRAPFFTAVDSLQSSFERGRVLQAVAKRSDASAETILNVIRSAQSMDSGFETAQVLLAVAASHPLSPEARGAYIDVSEKLGDYEQGRVLSALVRNEKRR